MVPYGLIVWLVLLYLLVRLWIVDGPRIPLVSIALVVLVSFGFPRLGLAGLPLQLFVIGLTIVLWFVDRYKSTIGLGR